MPDDSHLKITHSAKSLLSQTVRVAHVSSNAAPPLLFDDSGPFHVGELTISGHRILHENGCLSGNDVLICMEAICDSRGNNQKKDAFYCVN